MYKDYYYDLEVFDRIVTLSKLSEEIDDEFNSMSDEEKHQRMVNNDPTFLQCCYTFMISKNITECIINEFTYETKIINTDKKNYVI
jgi:hypothetical protein